MYCVGGPIVHHWKEKHDAAGPQSASASQQRRITGVEQQQLQQHQKGLVAKFPGNNFPSFSRIMIVTKRNYIC